MNNVNTAEYVQVSVAGFTGTAALMDYKGEKHLSYCDPGGQSPPVGEVLKAGEASYKVVSTRSSIWAKGIRVLVLEPV